MEDWRLNIKEKLGVSDEEWEEAMSIAEEEIKLRSEKIDGMEKLKAEFEETKTQKSTIH